MYRVLLVDDEKIIREGVYELLAMTDMDLDLSMAASAVEAISMMEARKFDIIIMDIRMPQMSGLELFDVIRERWPRCKLIFLTGHLKFDYVYKVHAYARYVLKAEEDEKLVEAVRDSITEIENDLLLERATLAHSKHQLINKYYERMLLLKELVEGSTSSACITQELLNQLGANISLHSPVYCVMVRCTGVRQLDYVRQAQAGTQLGLLIERFFLETWNGNLYGYNKHLTYLLLQPKATLTQDQALVLLEGCSETFQKAVEKNMGMAASVFISRDPVDIHRAVNDLLPISDRMVTMAADEICIGTIHEDGCGHGDHLSERIRQGLSRQVQRMEHQLENMDRQGIDTLLLEIRERVRGIRSMQDLFVMELYCSVSTKILSFAKKAGFNQKTAQHIGITELYNISQYSDWDSAFLNLSQVISHAFDHVDTAIETKNEDVVNRVKSYILTHLNGDTSLYALSGHVHLCPEHLLRVFKRQEGVTILQYINDLKLEKAKQLLSGTDVPIKEIANKLGFASAGYFSRFIKSKLGVTPNVYREQNRG